MSAYFIYIVSSLPALQFGARPPISSEQFFDICERFMSEKELAILKSVQEADNRDSISSQPVVNRLHAFESALRNELVRVRTARKKEDAAKYLRPSDYDDANLAHVAAAARRNASLLEGEKYLDLERWRFLDTMAIGHYFDMDILIIYLLKLTILERWEKIRTCDREAALVSVAGGN